MDFFNKLGKKASETYQFTKEKATNISGELKIRGKINECKEKIYLLYREIGEMVYAEMRAGTDVSKDQITAKCEQITRLKEEIEKSELDILTLRNIKKCFNCGEDLELDCEFCSKCGTKQPKAEKVKVQVKDSKDTPDAKDAEVVEVKDLADEMVDE